MFARCSLAIILCYTSDRQASQTRRHINCSPLAPPSIQAWLPLPPCHELNYQHTHALRPFSDTHRHIESSSYQAYPGNLKGFGLNFWKCVVSGARNCTFLSHPVVSYSFTWVFLWDLCVIHIAIPLSVFALTTILFLPRTLRCGSFRCPTERSSNDRI